MKGDIITLYDNNNKQEDYKLLCIICKEYNYLLYTDILNTNVNKNVYAIKTKSLKKFEEVLPIDENEWDMIENTYKKLINT